MMKNLARLRKNNSDFQTKLKRSRNIEELQQTIAAIVNELGYSDFTFVPLERDWEYEKQQGILSTYPDEYWHIYEHQQLYTHDMLISFFRENMQPIFLSNVYNYYCDAPFNTELTMANRTIRQLHLSLGFLESYVIPVMASNGKHKFLFSIAKQNMSAGEFQTKVNKMGTELRGLGQAINDVCHTKFSILFDPPAPKTIDIAPKPLRVLVTLANEDLSITDVASKLCISPITAHQQIAAARRALNKKTNIGAIKEAIKIGLICYN